MGVWICQRAPQVPRSAGDGWIQSHGSAPPNQRLQRAGVFGRYWLVSALQVVQALCGWRAVARR